MDNITIVEGISSGSPTIRGGACKAGNFEKGSGVTLDANGKLNNVSVNSKSGLTVEELSKGIPHPKVGATTAGQIRQAGGDVIASPTSGNPNHATLHGITPQQAEDIFNPTIPNPAKQE